MAKIMCQTGRNSIKYNTIEDEGNLGCFFSQHQLWTYVKFEIYLNMVKPALFDVIDLFLWLSLAEGFKGQNNDPKIELANINSDTRIQYTNTTK